MHFAFVTSDPQPHVIRVHLRNCAAAPL